MEECMALVETENALRTYYQGKLINFVRDLDLFQDPKKAEIFDSIYEETDNMKEQLKIYS